MASEWDRFDVRVEPTPEQVRASVRRQERKRIIEVLRLTAWRIAGLTPEQAEQAAEHIADSLEREGDNS